MTEIIVSHSPSMMLNRGRISNFQGCPRSMANANFDSIKSRQFEKDDLKYERGGPASPRLLECATKRSSCASVVHVPIKVCRAETPGTFIYVFLGIVLTYP